ncbi:MAG TPA: hypothetical protein VIX19_17710, partial [Terriglobales bacterium]
FVTDTHCGTNCQVTKDMTPDKKCVKRCVREGSKYGLWVGQRKSTVSLDQVATSTGEPLSAFAPLELVSLKESDLPHSY